MKKHTPEEIAAWHQGGGSVLVPITQEIPAKGTHNPRTHETAPDGLEVVAWQHVFADGRIVRYSEDQADFPAMGDALKVEPLVTLASAQAAVAAAHDRWQDEFFEWTNMVTQRNQRITELETLVKKVHTAKGRHHTQLAVCDLYDAVGLANERPKK